MLLLFVEEESSSANAFFGGALLLMFKFLCLTYCKWCFPGPDQRKGLVAVTQRHAM